MIELARRHKLNVTEIYREIVSGETIAARPVMQRLLQEVEQGIWSGVLVMEIERLARGDTIDQGIMAQTFKFSETKIVTPMKTYDPNNEFDEEYFEFGLFMSRREYKTINRRLQRGRAAAVKEGKYVASMPPYGYKRIRLTNDKGFTLEPVPNEVEIVRLIFSLYINGETQEETGTKRCGIQNIARKLNQMKIPPIRHDYWQKETIHAILSNPVYIGQVRWNSRPTKKKMVDGQIVTSRPRNNTEGYILADGLHPAIIEKEVFEEAQRRLSEIPPAPVGYKSAVKNPFAGIIVCGKCGRRMVLRKGYSKPDYIVCHARACDNVSAPFKHIETKILDTLRSWIGDYKVQWEASQRLGNDSKELKIKALKHLENEMLTISKQLDKTHDLLEQEVYTTEQFLERSRALSDRLQKVKCDLSAIEDEIRIADMQEASRRDIIPKVEQLLEVYHGLPTAADKNDLLKEILEKVVYTKTVNGCFRGVSADDFEIVIYHKLPQEKNT